MALSIEEMRKRLQSAYPGGLVEVVDLTGTSDHWQVAVQSPRFNGLSRIQAHQQVMAVFAEELKTGEVHALTIRTSVGPSTETKDEMNKGEKR
jgi:stress-induced morphogen